MPWDGVHALVERARTGDRDAWTDLHALARDYLLGLAQRLLGPGWPHQTAHDLSQDTWVRFSENIGEFRGGTDDTQTAAVLRAWLGRTATQLAKNYRRDNRAKKRAAPAGTVRIGANGSSDSAVTLDPPSDDPTPSYYTRLQEQRAAVERALGRLSDAVDRQIAVLHLLQDWPLKQIADKLGVTYDQARSRMADIKRRLRDELRSRDDDLTQP